MVHSRLKHVEKINKHTKTNCATSWFYLEDHIGMHGQQNIKFKITLTVQLTFINSTYKKNFLHSFPYHQVTVRLLPAACVSLF